MVLGRCSENKTEFSTLLTIKDKEKEPWNFFLDMRFNET
jgi:hypothetical protein